MPGKGGPLVSARTQNKQKTPYRRTDIVGAVDDEVSRQIANASSHVDGRTQENTGPPTKKQKTTHPKYAIVLTGFKV